jgi:hypothetical protein
MNRLLVLLALFIVLISCGTSTFNSYDDAAYAGAICTDGTNIRVPDDYCPIGDGDAPAGYRYHWAYQPYRNTARNIDVVYVGYPVDTHVWVHQVPANVSTLHVDRGSFPVAPAAGQPRTAHVIVATEPVRQSSVTRGGLGSTSAAATPVGKAGPPPRPIPPPPSGARAMAAARAKARSK